eukprot:5293643-Pyramimonas_sp.AAC.1
MSMIVLADFLSSSLAKLVLIALCASSDRFAFPAMIGPIAAMCAEVLNFRPCQSRGAPPRGRGLPINFAPAKAIEMRARFRGQYLRLCAAMQYPLLR